MEWKVAVYSWDPLNAIVAYRGEWGDRPRRPRRGRKNGLKVRKNGQNSGHQNIRKGYGTSGGPGGPVIPRMKKCLIVVTTKNKSSVFWGTGAPPGLAAPGARYPQYATEVQAICNEALALRSTKSIPLTISGFRGPRDHGPGYTKRDATTRH